MKLINRFLNKLDAFQKRHRPAAFSYAVIKKYGEDNAGQQAALLTYYGFLALFPLLMILTTVVDTVVVNHPQLKETIISGLTDYFPLLGNQLASRVEGLHRSGPALVIGILFALYGTRGLADAFRRGVQNIWGIPPKDRAGFPRSLYKSLGLIIVGGTGFLAAAILAGAAAAAGHGFGFRALSIAINLFILYWLFTFLINFSLPRHVKLKETRLGAAAAAIGLVILQLFGGYILAHELKGLDALYSYFALALGLLFWIYLQAQMLYYSVEIAVVSSQKLWPRDLN